MIYRDFSYIKKTPSLHVVIGAFDGIHLGHIELINKVLFESKKNLEPSLIFSFEPLPKEFFDQKNFLGRILPIQEKEKRLESFKADYTIISEFKKIQKFSEKQLIESLLSKTDHIYLYAGNDFRMGRTNGELYCEQKITKIILPEIIINKKPCRASCIRELIHNGNLIEANKLLGYQYTIYSQTQQGNKIGRTINFPTINITINNQVIPEYGTYFGEITLFKIVYPTMIYVGKRPTIKGETLLIECHIIEQFPYKELASHTDIAVSFIQKIAEEKTFNSLAELAEMLYNYKQISLDLADKKYKK